MLNAVLNRIGCFKCKMLNAALDAKLILQHYMLQNKFLSLPLFNFVHFVLIVDRFVISSQNGPRFCDETFVISSVLF